MFTALKRLVTSGSDGRLLTEDEFGHAKNRPPTGVRTMDQHLQRKFARGVQYNMKIILKGDRNVGKTCLFLRLQGSPFREEYEATDEIQVSSIQWNYKATDDVVKVEVWDVVDKAKKRKKITGLKLSEESEDGDEDCGCEPALDAEFIDVYKGANGVIMLFDCTKGWTFDYVKRELPKVPTHIPVLVLANHRDMGHHRVVSADQVRGLIEELGRHEGAGSGQVRYAEASMRNGFGLKFLHKFFNLPFLHLQRETYLKLLETNCTEIQTTCQELDILQDSDEQDYDQFLHFITNKRRAAADQQSAQAKIVNGTAAPHPPSRSVSTPAGLSKGSSAPPVASVEPFVKPPPSIIIGAQNPLPVSHHHQQQSVKKSPVAKVEPQRNDSSPKHSASLKSQVNDSSKTELDSMPEDEQASLRSFLEEPMQAFDSTANLPNVVYESESEEEVANTGNPMVSGFEEDLEGEVVEETAVVPPAADRSTHSVSDSVRSMSIKSDPSEVRVARPAASVASSSSSFIIANGSEIGSETGSGSSKGKSGKSSKSKGKSKKESDSGTKSSSKKSGHKKKSKEEEEKKKLEEFLGPAIAGNAVDTNEYELF